MNSSSKAKGVLWKYLLVIPIATAVIFIFSLFMAAVAAARNDISSRNFLATSDIYNGELRQSAPSIGSVGVDNSLLKQLNLAPDADISYKLLEYRKNANIVGTVANVNIDADFVKKGLEYQPTYRTQFQATYTLANRLAEPAVVSFEFPFPFNLAGNELSNVSLFVNGQEIKQAKAKLKGSYGQEIDGLRWEGKLDAQAQAEIKVSYNTVGIARLRYEGFTNELGSQNFKLDLNINGTRSYNVVSGLSVDRREFGDNSVRLVWDKQNLFSTPDVNVLVGEKLSPGNQVARIYLLMAPLYLVLSSVIVWLSSRAGKMVRVKDLLIMTVLYVIYFPLLHYLASFTIDPTMEVFSGLTQVGNFSMPLYGAFIIGMGLIGALLIYLYWSVYGRKFAIGTVLPLALIFMGFFPLVITIPEYSLLLVLLGSVVLMAMFIRTRLSERTA
jgi:hypothetical protein